MNSTNRSGYVFALEQQIQRLKSASNQREIVHTLGETMEKFHFVEQEFIKRSIRETRWLLMTGYLCRDDIFAIKRIVYIDILELELKKVRKKGFLKTIVAGVSLLLGAAGAARLILELAKEHPETAKTIVSGVNELGNTAADNISYHPHDKPAIEVIKKGKDILAEITKHQLEEYHNSYKMNRP